MKYRFRVGDEVRIVRGSADLENRPANGWNSSMSQRVRDGRTYVVRELDRERDRDIPAYHLADKRGGAIQYSWDERCLEFAEEPEVLKPEMGLSALFGGRS